MNKLEKAIGNMVAGEIFCSKNITMQVVELHKSYTYNITIIDDDDIIRITNVAGFDELEDCKAALYEYMSRRITTL